MKERAVNKLREFNRYYLPILDVLGDSYLGSGYAFPEARVLYEIYMRDGITATTIAQRMGVDKSYISRIVKRHEKAGTLTRTVSKTDGRAYELHLTETGMEQMKKVDLGADQHAYALIRGLDEVDRQRLSTALETVTELLSGRKERLIM
ncbi:MAG: MarR family transcriptional regulator [Oscillibacter sp.]|nr:MarR family transcriptional regulator [Oscillibacter sp.]